MIDQKLLERVKTHNFTLKHISQAEFDKISNINFILFVFWLDKRNITVKKGHYRYTKDEQLTIYKEMAFNHYIGISYMALSFLMSYENYDYRQALYLLNYYYYKVSKKEVSDSFKQYFNDVISDDENVKPDLQYILTDNLLNSPSEKINALKKVYAYLTNRGFERYVIQNMISQKCLMMDKNYNLCFITYEDNAKTVVSAITKKGTGKAVFKCNYTAERYTGFYYAPKNTDNPTELFVFESCLDLFSFVQLVWQKKIIINNPYCCISLNGAYNQKYIYKVLSQNLSIKAVICCLDNDYSGMLAIENIKKNTVVNCYDLQPMLKELTDKNGGRLIKDWNESLKTSENVHFCVEQFLGI